MAGDRAQMSLSLPAELLRQVEEARWAAKVTRSEWVRQAIEEKLGRRRPKGGGK